MNPLNCAANLAGAIVGSLKVNLRFNLFRFLVQQFPQPFLKCVCENSILE